jgi:hypothetical protein
MESFSFIDLQIYDVKNGLCGKNAGLSRLSSDAFLLNASKWVEPVDFGGVPFPTLQRYLLICDCKRTKRHRTVGSSTVSIYTLIKLSNYLTL